MRKIIYPLIYISEWLLFSAVLLFFFLFNMVNLFNLIYIDMAWEEPISLTTSLMKSLLIVVGVGFVICLYIRNLTGNKVCNMIRQILWGALFGLNTLSSVFWLLISFATKVSVDDRILQLIISLICLALTIQIILLFRNQMKKNSITSDKVFETFPRNLRL